MTSRLRARPVVMRRLARRLRRPPVALGAPAVLRSLDRVHRALERFWRRSDRLPGGRIPDVARIALSTAVAEITINILRHAGSDRFRLSLGRSGDRVEACFADRGVPFAEPPVAPLPLLAEGGRGLQIARRAVDRVEYTRSADGENRWRLVVELEGLG